MADDLKDRGARDRSRVNVHEDHEVRYLDTEVGGQQGAAGPGGSESGCISRNCRQRVGEASLMSESSPATRRAPDDAVEPLVQYVQKHPVCTALVALAIGYVLGKIY